MGVTLEMFGLDELREELRKLPAEMMPEVASIVEEHARAAHQDIQQGYPVRTSNLHPGNRRKRPWVAPGNLRAGVRLTMDRSGLLTRAIVRSGAPHSHLYDSGKSQEYTTVTRTTKRGANRGRMPQAPLDRQMVPKAIKWRKKMREALTALVRKAGFDVDEAA